ncbi:MAG: Flp pilus assembly protein CpaB [Candidatus Susulua stagnicola]|nr:Flp pilus assembly protein CpaB [Candidatus Susulua stagnicola]
MDKRMLNLIIGIGLAVVAIMLIHTRMQQDQRIIQQLVNKGEILEIVLAETDISKDVTITQGMVSLRRIRSNAYQPGDLTSLDSAIGKFARVDILKGQHVNSGMIRSSAGTKFLSQRVPKGMRAMTLSVDKISAIEGLIKPSDCVDIIGTFNIAAGQNLVVTLFQGIKILATGKNISPNKINSTAETVTVALKPKDIKLLTYVLESGNKIRLTLRAPLDSSQEIGYAGVTFETLMKKLGMWAQPPQAQKKESTLQIYKGSQKEEISVSK